RQKYQNLKNAYSDVAVFSLDIFSPDVFSPDDLVDLGSSEEYESITSDDDFQEDENELGNIDANSIIDTKTGFEKKGRPVVYTGDSKRTLQRKRKNLRQAAAESSKITQFFITVNEDSGNGNSTKSETIDKTIKFVEEQFSIFSDYGLSIKESRGSKYGFGGELIRPTARGRFPSKSLLNDELVSLQLAAYLRTQKFEVAELDRLMSKWLDKDCTIRTFPCLNNNEREHVWITHDETTFYAYEGPRALWGPENKQPLRKKGMGL
ncbi:13167_t:CDS:2, partial [Acaulospora morrowiae]